MQVLDALTRTARDLANGNIVPSLAETEVARQMQICNACRYCEGFCAVFPAMTRRLEFGKADIHFLANLCHDCGACLHACQYAPPHEFAINVPRAMARVRVQTYADYAWPSALGKLYQHNGLGISLALVFFLALFLFLAVLANGAPWKMSRGADFYDIFPHGILVLLFVPVFLFASLALAIGVRRFLRDITVVTSGAPLISLLHFLRVFAVLCRHQRRNDIPLFPWPGSPLRLAEPAKNSRGRRRFRFAHLHDRVVLLETQAPPAAWRPGPETDGPRIHCPAVPGQCQWFCALAVSRDSGAAHGVVPALGRCHGFVCHLALWKIRAWHFPQRCLVALLCRAAAARPARPSRLTGRLSLHEDRRRK